MAVEEGGNFVRANVAVDESLANAADEDQGESSAARFLVVQHACNERLAAGRNGCLRKRSRKTDRCEMGFYAVGILLGAEAALGGEAAGQDQADCDRLAMQQPR